MKRRVRLAAPASAMRRWLFLLSLALGLLAGAGLAYAAVTLMYFKAEVLGNGILLRWETGSEINNVGFYLYRATVPAQQGEALIFIESTMEVMGYYYKYLDAEVTPGVTYYYTLGALDTNGHIEYYGPVTATFPSLDTPTPSPTPTATPTSTPIPTDTPTGTPTTSATATPAASQPSTPTRTPTRPSWPTSTPTPTWTAAPEATNTPGATDTPTLISTPTFTAPSAPPTAPPGLETPTPPATATPSPASAPEPSLPSVEAIAESPPGLQPPIALAVAPPPARQLPPTATPSPRSPLPSPANAMLYLAGGSLGGALALAIVALALWRSLR